MLGWVLLALPFAQATPVPALDALFISVSALSTTGLVTVDPGSSFSPAGQVVILVLIQIGGLGYMTISSFAYLALTNRLGGIRLKATRAAFGLSDAERVGRFLRAAVLFTLAVEAMGAFTLTVIFYNRGVENPLWQGVFHSVSAFCTAGFSLFPDSLLRFSGDGSVIGVTAALSVLGSVGFIIVVDVWRWIVGETGSIGFSSRVILFTTLAVILAGTILIAVADVRGQGLPDAGVVRGAFYQAMSASTTVGFNTIDVGKMHAASLLVLIVLMIIGASPAGTGGGLKTTTFAALFGIVRSVLRGRREMRLAGRTLGPDRVHLAAATFVYYVAILVTAVYLLVLTEPGADFMAVLFEATSALSTVGLSMGLTGNLSPEGKAVIILLMFAGRVGILTFGTAMAIRHSAREDDEGDDGPADLAL